MSEYSTTAAAPVAAPHEELCREDPLLAPDKDRFYRAPSGYQDADPGDVLRSRTVELGFLGVIRQRVHATQLLYRSTNLHGEPEVAVTTVLVPERPSPGEVRNRRGRAALLSFVCAAARREADWRVRTIGVFAGRGGAGAGVGGFGARP
jgi:hypothetical protein